MFLTLEEAAKELRLSKETVRIKFANGQIPGAFRTNGEKGYWRISESDLKRWRGETKPIHG